MVNPKIQDKRQYFKIRPKYGGQWCVGERAEVLDMLDMIDDENEYEIQETWMTPKEYSKLKEFEGW